MVEAGAILADVNLPGGDGALELDVDEVVDLDWYSLQLEASVGAVHERFLPRHATVVAAEDLPTWISEHALAGRQKDCRRAQQDRRGDGSAQAEEEGAALHVITASTPISSAIDAATMNQSNHGGRS